MLGLGGFFAVPVCFQRFPGSGPKMTGSLKKQYAHPMNLALTLNITISQHHVMRLTPRLNTGPIVSGVLDLRLFQGYWQSFQGHLQSLN